MLTEDKVIEIFVMADEFCKVFNAMFRCRGLDKPKEIGVFTTATAVILF